MPKRVLIVQWKAINGAAVKKRKLHLAKNADDIYQCPVETCLHSGFKSERGLRKHINVNHSWYYWFDKQPPFNRCDATERTEADTKKTTHKMPAFSLECGMGLEFMNWLQTTCGGDKDKKEALQIGRRAMKFLMWAMGSTVGEEDAKAEYIDVCVGSPSIVNGFVKAILEEWNISASAALSYAKAINDLMDFRKACGVSDNVLRSFVVTEVYLRRGKVNLRKRKNMEYSRNLDLETLIAKSSWASLEELETVIPFHSDKYQQLVKKCKEHPEAVGVVDTTFCTRFIVTFLFLRVKFSRPMSFRFITLELVKNAKENGGYIDATKFKTSQQYMFDTLVFTADTLDILQSYIDVVRPLLKPKCDYVLVSAAGTQYSALGSAMSLLVHEAIGKTINPTRYRQIVETESSIRLNEMQRRTLSDDMKHTSYVAKRSYVKRASRETATKASVCMTELVGEGREKHTSNLAESIRTLTATQEPISDQCPSDDTGDEKMETTHDTQLGTEPENVAEFDSGGTEEQVAVVGNVGDETSTRSEENSPTDDVVITYTEDAPAEPKQILVIDDNDSSRDCETETCPGVPDVSSLCLEEGKSDDDKDALELEIKKEDAEKEVRKKDIFTEEEDDFIRQGVKKHGYGHWSEILKDPEYKFHDGRSRDAVRMRSTKLGLREKKSTTKSNVPPDKDGKTKRKQDKKKKLRR